MSSIYCSTDQTQLRAYTSRADMHGNETTLGFPSVSSDSSTSDRDDHSFSMSAHSHDWSGAHSNHCHRSWRRRRRRTETSRSLTAPSRWWCCHRDHLPYYYPALLFLVVAAAITPYCLPPSILPISGAHATHTDDGGGSPPPSVSEECPPGCSCSADEYVGQADCSYLGLREVPDLSGANYTWIVRL